ASGRCGPPARLQSAAGRGDDHHRDGEPALSTLTWAIRPSPGFLEERVRLDARAALLRLEQDRRAGQVLCEVELRDGRVGAGASSHRVDAAVELAGGDGDRLVGDLGGIGRELTVLAELFPGGAALLGLADG